MIIFIFALALDLTHLSVNQILNHTAQFKSQLQIDNSKQVSPIPQNQHSDQTRMNQILYEQEEKAHPRIIKIHDTPPPSPYKPKYEVIPDEDKPQTNAKLPRKKLQEESLPGEPILDVISIAPIAQKHKVALLIFMILLLCVFILMRETYTHWLHKIFRKALWKISLETLYITFVLIVFIALYYNNYFDFWLLNSQYKQDKGKGDILLIEIHDYDESYKYNIYAYLLIAGLIIMILYFISALLIFLFDKQMKSWFILESAWENKQKLLEIYKQANDEQLIKKSEECMDYLLIKTQFLSQMTPYLGPKILSDTFDLSAYLGHVAAETIYRISIWDKHQYLIYSVHFFLLVSLLYLFNIVIVSILCCIILFVYIINLNYTLTMIKEKSMIKKDYDILIQEELQVVPPFMEPIFENILPKRPVDIQSDLFPFGNKNYIIVVLSALLKISTTLIFIVNVYFYYWVNVMWYTNLICNMICICTWISIIYISCGIISQFTLTDSISIRNYEFVYSVIARQKQTLIEACGSLYEFARFIRKSSLQHVLDKDNLLLLRPVMVDIIDVCKSYQKRGMQQVKFDPREIELVDLGIESMDLIHKKYLKKIINILTDRYSEQDMVYISSFCSDENPDYFSPIKLILYLHLRQQEIKINDRQILKDVFQQIIPMQYEPVQQFEGDVPDDYIQQGLEGDVDLNRQSNLSTTKKSIDVSLCNNCIDLRARRSIQYVTSFVIKFHNYLFDLMKDMTAMIRPQFKQVHPVDYKFASSIKEIDEFKYEQQVFRYNDLRFSIRICYFTLYGLVDGDLEFNKQQIQFIANKSKVKELLIKETGKEEKDINEQLLSKFQFTIHLEDIHSVQQKGQWIQIMLFGLDKIDIPVLDHQNEISVIAIQLLIDSKPPPEITNLIKSLTNGLDTIQGLLGYILQLNRYQNNKKTFRSLVRKCKQSKPYPTMICLSQISYYDIVALSKLGVQHHIDYYQPNISTLNKPSGILSPSYFEFLANNMPEQVSGNKWFQVFNPKFHGISYQELLRRVRNIQEHFIIIRDNDNVFGAFLEQGWYISEHYYGGSQSFVFTFKNNGYRIYHSSKLNNNYQICDEQSLQIGGDEAAITIQQNLLNGETGGSLTFGNELLSSSKFNIQELEIWGVQDDCELVMRHLRLESDFHIDQQ